MGVKIAIVGNGKLSKNYGVRIDKHDVVIRFNHARIRGFEKKVGTKTDILALAGTTYMSYPNEAARIDNDIIREVSWVMFSGRKRNEEYEKLLLHKKEALLGGQANIMFNYVGSDCYFDLVRQVRGVSFEGYGLPSTGINILCYELYTHDFKSGKHRFDVYGFDCFESGHYFDDERRDNIKFHDLESEKAIIQYLQKNKNIYFYS